MTDTAKPPHIFTRQATWDDAAEAWHDWSPMIEQWLGPVTEMMLERAGIAPGSRVLDVAAGAGGEAVRAARRVGPEGAVLATDLSPEFVAHAGREFAAAGLTNAEARVMDAEHLDVPDDAFDAAICRLGLMFFPRPAAALREIRRALRPGGIAAMIVFGPPGPILPDIVGIIRRHIPLPPPLPGFQPGLFSLGTPGLLAAAYADAGYRDVQIDTVPTTQHFASSEECAAFTRSTVMNALIAGASAAQEEAVWRDVTEAYRPLTGSAGCIVPYDLLLAVGTK